MFDIKQKKYIYKISIDVLVMYSKSANKIT